MATRKRKSATSGNSGALTLRDVSLWASNFERYAEYASELHDGHSKVQSRRSATIEQLTSAYPSGEEETSVRLLFEFGIRMVAPVTEKDLPVSAALKSNGDIHVLHSVEATFACNYQIVDTYKEERQREYLQSGLQLVWPLWRQHVTSVLASAMLPVIVVPSLPPEVPQLVRDRRNRPE